MDCTLFKKQIKVGWIKGTHTCDNSLWPTCRGFDFTKIDVRGVDSSYHVLINASLRRDLIEALAYIIYTRRRYYFSLVCTCKRAIQSSKVRVDVQKSPLRFRDLNIIDVEQKRSTHNMKIIICMW